MRGASWIRMVVGAWEAKRDEEVDFVVGPG